MYFCLENDMDALASLIHNLAEEPAFLSLTPDQQYTLQLALEEMVTNIIKYGYDDGDKHHICIYMDFLPAGGVCVELSDDGHPFNPLVDAQESAIADDLLDQEIGGLGVTLVREMTDEVHYRRENGRNILSFIIGETRK